MDFPLTILVHLLAASSAIVVGGTMLALKKGTRLHRISGRVLVMLMLTATLASFGMRRSGQFSRIHLLPAFVLFGLGAALYLVYHRNIKAHQGWMTGLYIGTFITGILTLLPGRPIGNPVWHAAGFI